jgi:hypothetical protein
MILGFVSEDIEKAINQEVDYFVPIVTTHYIDRRDRGNVAIEEYNRAVDHEARRLRPRGFVFPVRFSSDLLLDQHRERHHFNFDDIAQRELLVAQIRQDFELRAGIAA